MNGPGGKAPKSREDRRLGRPQRDTEAVVDLDAVRLIERARAGDAAAFEGLYRLHAGRVFAICLRLCGDPARAEELVQDVFVRVWRRLDSFQGRSAFSTWLYRLATNVVLDALRAEIRRSARETPVEEPADWETPKPPAPPGLGLDLEAAIASLPTGARMVFVLHEVEGYRHEEIAEMAGLAEGTCKAQLHRARRLLRERLGS